MGKTDFCKGIDTKQLVEGLHKMERELFYVLGDSDNDSNTKLYRESSVIIRDAINVIKYQDEFFRQSREKDSIMTIPQALNHFKAYVDFYGDNLDEKAFNILQRIARKSYPVKPIKCEEQNVRYVTKYECPTCGKEFTSTGLCKYCYHCGQKFDWSE